MPEFTYPRPTGDDSPVDPWLLARLLEERTGGPGPHRPVDPDERRLADVVSALRAPATDAELTGEASAVAAFVAAAGSGVSRTTREHRGRRRIPVLSTVLASKLAVAACAGAVTLGGTAAAAYTGSLPAPLQGFAHDTIGAPSDDGGTSGGLGADPTSTPTPIPTPTVEPSPTAEASPAGEPSVEAEPTPSASPSTAAVGHGVGPDATGPAAKGLCTAYLHGGLGPKSISLRNLTLAAGSEDDIPAYCAAVLIGAPTPTADPTSDPTLTPSLVGAQATGNGNGHGKANGNGKGHAKSNGHGNPHR